MDYNNQPQKVEIKGEEFKRPTRFSQTPTPKIIQWVIKYSNGHIKDEKQANYFLIGFVALAIIISLFLIFMGGSQKKNYPVKDYFSNLPSVSFYR